MAVSFVEGLVGNTLGILHIHVVIAHDYRIGSGTMLAGLMTVMHSSFNGVSTILVVCARRLGFH